MDDLERDRRDSPDAEDASPASPDSTPPEPAAEPADVPAAAPTEPWAAQPDPAEIESWPSQEPVAAEPSWPTEAPSAEPSPDAGWPTEPPERGEPPILEPDWTPEPDAEAPAAAEPPPGEVEAYARPPAPASLEATEEHATASDASPAHAVPSGTEMVGESTQCPRCGTENRPGLSFCNNCGQRLVAAGVASTVERPGAPEGTMACPRCGTHNRAGVGFCQNCGANLRGTAPGYVPPSVAVESDAEVVSARSGGAVLGPVVLLIGLIGIVTGYLLPFLYGTGSLFERAAGPNGYGIAFWTGYPEVGAGLTDQLYYGLAGPVPILGLLLLVLAVAGFARAIPGPLQVAGLGIALLWSVGLIVLFGVVELAGNWSGDLVGMLRVMTPAGIIFFLGSLIVLIGTLTRFGRS